MIRWRVPLKDNVYEQAIVNAKMVVAQGKLPYQTTHIFNDNEKQAIKRLPVFLF